MFVPRDKIWSSWQNEREYSWKYDVICFERWNVFAKNKFAGEKQSIWEKSALLPFPQNGGRGAEMESGFLGLRFGFAASLKSAGFRGKSMNAAHEIQMRRHSRGHKIRTQRPQHGQARGGLESGKEVEKDAKEKNEKNNVFFFTNSVLDHARYVLDF